MTLRRGSGTSRGAGVKPLPAWLRARWVRMAANAVAAIPLVVLCVAYATGMLGFDPIKALTVRTGRLAITFLLLSLACTPIAIVTGWNRSLQARRSWGLWSLGYAVLHFLTFAGLDYRLDLDLLWGAIAYQPFVLVGAGALLLLAVLGVSSWPALRTRMGRSWRWVQRLVYPTAIVVVWHALWARKSFWEVWWYPVILAVLLLVRVPVVRGAITRVRRGVLK